jgi:hypothetical protein
MAALAAPVPLPPGSTSPVRALAWAVAIQQAGVATLWMDRLHPFSVRSLSLADAGGPALVVAAAVAAAHVLVPVAARARSGLGAVASSMALCVVGGALANLAAARLSHFDVLDDMFGGAFAGFFSGIAAATVVVHRLRMRDQALDGVVRLYAFAGASLLPTAVLLAGRGVGLHGALTSGAPCLSASAGLLCAAFAFRRRRLAWLDAVREGRVPGFRVEETDAPVDVPPFAGSSEGARGVVLQDFADRSAHPFRGDCRTVPVARIHLDRSEVARQASGALGRALLSGTLAGIVVLPALLLPAEFLRAGLS